MTDALREAIVLAATKQALEDLYLPYKPRRRTRAMVAREAGIEPLADALFANPGLVPAEAAAAYVQAQKSGAGDDFTTLQAVLDGVRDILSERWAEDARLVQDLREWLWQEGLLRATRIEGKDENHADVSKFRDYFDYAEPIARVPSHRALAVFGGGAWIFWTPSCNCLRPRQAPLWEPSRWPRRGWPCVWAGATRGAPPTI